MHTLKTENNAPIRMLMDMFGEYLVTDDYMEFFSNRRKGTTDTYLRLDIYKAPKISTIIAEEYGVRGKLTGHVIILFPDPAYDVPIFMFQLGGNATQSIALLDIASTRPGMDYAPLQPAFEKYRGILDPEKPTVDWVRSISSPFLLDCQYGALDVDRFMDATREYLRIWIESYYKPAVALASPEAIEAATNAIHRYKKVVYEGDPAHGIFSKAWGKKVADAMIYLEMRDHPALEIAN
ncbi:MAG: hypothetical protein ABI567_02160 [Gammaproteobacteria bacterium]